MSCVSTTIDYPFTNSVIFHTNVGQAFNVVIFEAAWDNHSQQINLDINAKGENFEEHNPYPVDISLLLLLQMVFSPTSSKVLYSQRFH